MGTRVPKRRTNEQTLSKGKFQLSGKSGNSKIGTNCAVTTSPRQTCPTSCPLMGAGCYAENWPMVLHWNKLSEGKKGQTWEEHLSAIRKLPMGRYLRINQAGDLPSDGATVNRSRCLDLAKVSGSRGKVAWTYTHHDPGENSELFEEMTQRGLTVNLSANSAGHALKLMKSGHPVTTVVPEDFKSQKIDGVRFVVCPAVGNKTISCSGGRTKHDYGKMNSKGDRVVKYYDTAPCGGGKGPLCARADRDYVIAFPAHGPKRKDAEAITKGFAV